MVQSKETKEKISKSIQNLWKNPTYRKKVIIARNKSKRKHSNETKEKISKAMIGRECSKEEKENKRKFMIKNGKIKIGLKKYQLKEIKL